jgi:hypothetical protein
MLAGTSVCVALKKVQLQSSEDMQAGADTALHVLPFTSSLPSSPCTADCQFPHGPVATLQAADEHPEHSRQNCHCKTCRVPTACVQQATLWMMQNPGDHLTSSIATNATTGSMLDACQVWVLSANLRSCCQSNRFSKAIKEHTLDSRKSVLLQLLIGVLQHTSAQRRLHTMSHRKTSADLRLRYTCIYATFL